MTFSTVNNSVLCLEAQNLTGRMLSLPSLKVPYMPFLFLLYVNDLPNQDQGQSKLFADDAKFFQETQTLSNCALLQQDLNLLSAWTRNWQIQFNLEKCVVMRIRQSLHFAYYIDGYPLIMLIEVDQQKDLEVIVSNDLNMLKPSKHRAEITKKANQRLDMIRRCFTNHSRSVISPIYKTIVRPILKTSSSVWNPWLQKDINQLEKVQHRCTHLCTDPLQLEPLFLRKRKRDLAEVCKCVNGISPLALLFNFLDQHLRGHRYKPDKPFARTQIRQNFFCDRVVNDWNQLQV